MNWSFEVEKPPPFWKAILESGALARISRGAIITCQGKRGWDDYLLLHHFDPAEELDTLD